ncbi:MULTISPECIES: hypothetical protein [Deinococcus]|uniref:ABC transporter substrate-binding protein n=1 Tax=Deinococcus rufus TaxID=2136097 RepID=A0ABV7Z6A5_9DEIO|nr:hypothetical protein [Deinococcus sp. AB2017081]WQE96002.1 hypothetical protein U2P90_03680 [Deinococcus sp. AB2017081]
MPKCQSAVGRRARLSLGAVCAAALLLLSACGGGGPPATTTPPGVFDTSMWDSALYQ